MCAHPCELDTVAALANTHIDRTGIMVTDNRIQEDVQTALLQDPRINHPELIAVPADIPAPPADSATDRLVSLLGPFSRVIQPKLYASITFPPRARCSSAITRSTGCWMCHS